MEKVEQRPKRKRIVKAVKKPIVSVVPKKEVTHTSKNEMNGNGQTNE